MANLTRKKVTYPLYQFSADGGLVAFLAPADMYRILNVGSNSGNEGVTVDHYRTRRMVIKHMRAPNFDIDRDRFRYLYNSCFNSILLRITEI